jgi:hypothetical protein
MGRPELVENYAYKTSHTDENIRAVQGFLNMFAG